MFLFIHDQIFKSDKPEYLAHKKWKIKQGNHTIYYKKTLHFQVKKDLQ